MMTNKQDFDTHEAFTIDGEKVTQLEVEFTDEEIEFLNSNELLIKTLYLRRCECNHLMLFHHAKNHKDISLKCLIKDCKCLV